jgi:prephenate dehydratase
MAKKADIAFSIASLEGLNDKKLNEIVSKVMQSKKGASALKSMMRSVTRSALKSTVKSVMKSPLKGQTPAAVKSPGTAKK